MCVRSGRIRPAGLLVQECAPGSATLTLKRFYSPLSDYRVISTRSARATATRSKKKVSLDEIEQKLGITQPEDWYTVNMTDLYEMGLPKRIRTIQFVNLLKERYPDVKWDKMIIMKGRFGQQRRLEHAVSSMFMGEDVLFNARKEAGILNPGTGRFLELDVYLPSLNLGFEYQERHHYVTETAYANKSLDRIVSRDKLKQKLAAEGGLTLIIVPCWWDNRIDSLAATIRLQRPDLAARLASIGTAEAINERPPIDFFAKHVTKIADVGQPTNPGFFISGQTDPTNWWIFEKYDGIRGFWNPLKKTMYSRTGKPFVLPPHILEEMPQDIFLDGEIWFGRENFQEAMKLAHRMESSRIAWGKFKYMVFDTPTAKGNYAERYTKMKETLEGRSFTHLSVAGYVVCQDTEHLNKIFQDFIEQGGEGVILRDPVSPYQPGRSSGYLKHKKYRDAEARIVGRAGPVTWECEMPNGVRFVAPAGTTEFARRWDPKPGDIVSYKHRGYMLGSHKPKVPTLYRIRDDLSWEDAVNNWKEDSLTPEERSRLALAPRTRRYLFQEGILPSPGNRRPLGFWNDVNNYKQFFDELGKQLGITKLSDWYQVSRQEVARRGGYGVLNKTPELAQALKVAYPDFEWDNSRFTSTSLHQPDTQRKLLGRIGEQLGIKEPSDWYDISREQVASCQGGRKILRHYPSVGAVLMALYPDEPWEASKFVASALEEEPKRNNVDKQRALVNHIGQQLNIKELSDWYRVSREEFKLYGGWRLFKIYSSVEAILRAMYPEYPWDPTLFAQTAKKMHAYWHKGTNHRQFLENIGKQLGVVELSDWYRITPQDLLKRGGWRLLKKYTSMDRIMKTFYPHYPWDSALFIQAGLKYPAGYWNDSANVSRQLQRAEEQLGIKSTEDWYSIRITDLRELGFPSHYSKLQLSAALKEKYPQHNWDVPALLRGRYIQQKTLEHAIRSLFPGVDMQVNARKEAQLLNPETGDYLELDIWLPSLNLAFEYQEKHHYSSAEYTYQPLQSYQQKDETKRKLASEKGLSLVTVPFWWDGNLESLGATIKQCRPDLLPDRAGGEPIPTKMPERVAETTRVRIEGIGEPMTACFLTKTNVDPTNWWMFEKYDGLRAFWNPSNRTFYSRYGNAFAVPKEIVDSMPNDLFLDGEFWFGRDNFQEVTKISNRSDQANVDWREFKYMVFDVPNSEGTYQQRYSILESYAANKPGKYVHLAPRHICTGTSHLESFFQDIIDQGGEGIILRDPTGIYEIGRSQGYLKHKRFRDAEARIVECKTENQVWECELPNGVTFTAPAGTSEFSKRWHPTPGDIVSFKHRGFLLHTKKPKLPAIYRLRTDLTWKDLLDSWKDPQLVRPASQASLHSQKERKWKPRGYWADIQNRRDYFGALASRLGINAENPEEWKKVSYEQLGQANGLLKKYRGNLKHALSASFPELDFSVADRGRLPHGYWQDQSNRRAFFDKFALEKGFDPCDPEGWYSASMEQLLRTKGAVAILRYTPLKKAIQEAYPNVQFLRWQPEQSGQVHHMK